MHEVAGVANTLSHLSSACSAGLGDSSLCLSLLNEQTSLKPYQTAPNMAALTLQEKVACNALSRLFLDTEKTPGELDSIAASLRPLNIPTATLGNLLRFDVFPIVYPNLLSVAGTWDGFDDEWLLGQIEAQRKAGPRWAKSLADQAAWWTVGRMVMPAWESLKGRLEAGSKL